MKMIFSAKLTIIDVKRTNQLQKRKQALSGSRRQIKVISDNNGSKQTLTVVSAQ